MVRRTIYHTAISDPTPQPVRFTCPTLFEHVVISTPGRTCPSSPT
uniref:Uncharacterized protein n=1 Tax=Romanomermis culicivorax TaxID=13658 RepID=A0A915KDV7_ROMCU